MIDVELEEEAGGERLVMRPDARGLWIVDMRKHPPERGGFLSPVLLFLGWANPKVASGVAAVFILVNSIAGLSGNLASVQALPASLPLFAASVLAGAVVGTTLGIRFKATYVIKALGVVLLVAGFKLMDFY